MTITITPEEVRVLLRAGVLSIDPPPFREARPDYATAAGEHADLELAVAQLKEARATLEADCAVLQARAAAARPVVEAEAVIARAADQWRAIDRAFRGYCEAASAADDSAAWVELILVTRAELQRCIQALGSTLGEEGGDEAEG